MSIEKSGIKASLNEEFESITTPVNASKPSVWANVKDSFQRAVPDDEKHESVMRQSITKGHLRMMALSTGLGTGLLVGSGSKLRSAGPLGMLIAYAIVGYIMLVPTIASVSELAIAYSGLPGGFQSYYAKFVDESLGFALGWSYCIQWICVISLELVTFSMTIKFWNTDINANVWVTICFIVVVAVNFCGSKGYSEAEFYMNGCKVLMLVGFILFGIIINTGGGPQGFVGGRYYHDPGAVTSFKGIAGTTITAAFSLGGSEFISLSASEVKNPKHAIRAASKWVYLKVTVLFLGSLTLVGLLVPYNNPNLMGSSSGEINASPYVIAAQLHGVMVIPHIINAVILISVTSVAIAAMYSSPRLLQSLADQGLAPKYFNYVDKHGRPLRAWVLTIICTFFSYIAAFEHQDIVFNWLLSISGVSFVFVWMFICVCHLRFRAALKHRNIPLSSLAYVAPTGIIGSWLSIVVNFLMLVGQFWVALFPIGSDRADANNFFQNYLGVPVLFILYFAHKLWTKNWKLYKRVDEIDLDTGMVYYDPEILELEKLEEQQRFKNANFLKKIYIFCLD